MPSSTVRPSFTTLFSAAPAQGSTRPARALTAPAMGLPRLTACAVALILSGLPLVSHAAKQSPESEIFTRMDFPDGLPFLGADTRMKAALKQRWQETQARGGFTSYGEPWVNSLGMLERVQISPNYPVPASALTGALDGQVWNEFWVLSSQSAVEGQQQAPRSTATRYALRCQPLTVMELGWVYYPTLDASGEPRSVSAEYNRVRSAGVYQTSTPNHMARVKETCGKEFDALQQQQADARAKEQAARIEDIQKVLAVQLHKALDPATAIQIGTMFQATMMPESAASASGNAAGNAAGNPATKADAPRMDTRGPCPGCRSRDGPPQGPPAGPHRLRRQGRAPAVTPARVRGQRRRGFPAQGSGLLQRRH
ncbi:hypothetical protein [Roseateles depolymerans]|nr:hypothetical protein [Roseateles depolymerans]